MMDMFEYKLKNMGQRTEQDVTNMRNCIKEELLKYSHLTQSKNPTTAEQIIKMLEMKDVYGQTQVGPNK